jgi:hypothetical protein
MEASGRLDELIVAAEKQTVVIVSGGHAVRLVPVPLPTAHARRAGTGRGRVHMAPDFDAPLADFAEYE